jgi:sugar O-acyltransferase (sialic acid O-acetyltransferase NeuD family)
MSSCFGAEPSDILGEMSRPRAVVVYGAGGHGRVVADAAQCAGFEVLGFLDDQSAVGAEVGSGRVLGGSGWWRGHPDVDVVLAVGDNSSRQRLGADLARDGRQALTVVHPSAVVSGAASLGPGVVVLALAVVNTDAKIGAGAIVNSAAVVEHDVIVGNYAHVSPNSTLAGAAQLGDSSQLGAGACVLPGIAVGSRSVVGAGAVVTHDVPGGSVCAGVPARVLRRLEP